MTSRTAASVATAIALAASLFVVISPVVPAAASSTWLDRLNAWRANVGVPALTENTTWDAGDYDHSVYMVKNDLVTHYEDPTKPYYTAAGDQAAKSGNIEVSSTTSATDPGAIDWWMAAPFHALGMMDPRLASTGFGAYRDSTTSPWQAGFTLDTLRGNPFTGGAYPVYFPGNGSTEPLTNYSGNESPDPLALCSGYTMPVGLPLFIQVGGFVNTTVSAATLVRASDAASLQVCAFDSHAASVGSMLYDRGAVVIIPRQPLQTGQRYVVAVTVNGVPYTWSFTVGSLGPNCVVGAGGAPTVIAAGPAAGPAAGATPVTIQGCGFTGATGVSFGTTAASSFTVVSDNAITAVSPVHAAGTVDITVTTPSGTSATSAADQFTFDPYSSYFQWFDLATPGMVGDNIHLLNTGATPAHVAVTLPGAPTINVSVQPGNETYVSFGRGHIGGPVVVNSDQPVLASQRVQYFQSFNEVWSMSAAQASTDSYIQWFDRATPGMVGDNIHVLNPGATNATVTVTLEGGSPIVFNLSAGAERFVTFPVGAIGGPVHVSSTQPVLASQRVQYYQSFNEVIAQSPSQALTTGYFNWFDKATPGMVNDNVHVLNPGAIAASVTVRLPGAAPVAFALAAGQETYVSFPRGSIGGPVTVTSDQPVLTSQRVQYFDSFNEVWAVPPSAAATTSYVTWFDRATPGMVGDNIHLLNPGGVSATVTVSLAGATPMVVNLGAGVETYVSFAGAYLGGPVVISATQPVLAASRVQYFQSFNEVSAA